MKKTRVWITGLGIQSAIGKGIQAFNGSLQAGRCEIKRIEVPVLDFPVLCAALPSFDFKTELDQLFSWPAVQRKHLSAIAHRLNPELQATLLAALEAWVDAGFEAQDCEPNRIGIVATGDNALPALRFEYSQKFLQEPNYLSPQVALQWIDSHVIGIISEALGIQGEGWTVGGASASGNVAILQAYRALQLGELDACLVVGALTKLSPVELQALHNSGALGGRHFADLPSQACRPFDKAHEGFIPGEASAALMLETEESMQRSGVIPYAELCSGAMRLSATRFADPDEASEVAVMQQALASAKLFNQNVDYINTHGTSTPLGDITEINALQKVLGSRCQEVWMNATKGLTGHCLGSAGVIEAAAICLQLKHGFLHPNRNLEDPIDPNGRWVGAESVAVNSVRYALSNSFGFGGIHTSLLLAKPR